MTPAEYDQIVNQWNQTTSDYARSEVIATLIERQVAAHPHKTVLNDMTNSLSYDEFNRRANQLAHYLRANGVGKNTIVAICLPPCMEQIIGIAAILKAGGAYLPLDPHNPVERLRYIIEDARSPVLITATAESHLAANAKQPITLIALQDNKAEIAKCDTSNLPQVNEPEDLAYVIYTSGSTGRPKGVMVTQHNVTHFTHWFKQALPFSHEDVFDYSSSISFDFCVPNTLFPLFIGAEIAICSEDSKRDPALYIDHLLRNKITVIKLTPSYFRQLKEFVTIDHDFIDLKFIVLGGETTYVKDVADWLTRFPHHQFLNEYGPTEATVATTAMVIEREKLTTYVEKIPIGKPVANSSIYILDADNQPVAIGTLGEIYIGGEGVAQGYLHHPDMTAARFVQITFRDQSIKRLYKTGDLARFLPDGNIEFHGRMDDQIKIRGYRIELREIEICLEMHPAIREAVVIVKEDGLQSADKQLVAYWIAKDGVTTPTTQQLQQFLQQHLPEYMVPAAMINLSAFPLTPNGKLDRKALPAPQLTARVYIAPRTQQEHIMHDIWSQVLDIKEISIDDNIFELGGHSLSAARIISKIKKIMRREIRLKDLYGAPSIREFTKMVEQTPEIYDSHALRGSIYLEDESPVIPLSEMQIVFWLAQKWFPRSRRLNIVDRKRILGHIDATSLRLAFEMVLHKHPILSYKTSAIFPMQSVQKNVEFHLHQQNLIGMASDKQEEILLASLIALKSLKWKKGVPLIHARLFNLSTDCVELQVAIDHMVSDEVSPTIIFDDLSAFYQESTNHLASYDTNERYHYVDYTLLEKRYIETHLHNDMKFWDQYLRDACAITFPDADVIANTRHSRDFLTTYLAFPEPALTGLRQYCMQHRLSIPNSLCAAVALAIEEFVKENANGQKNCVIGFVRSTRDTEFYDETIGFFVRPDLIKINMDDNPSFENLTRRVHQSMIDTEAHQPCPYTVKLAYMLKHCWQTKKIKDKFIKTFTYTYAKLFKRLRLHPEVLTMYARLFLALSDKNFTVNLNILNNFMDGLGRSSTLFGYDIQPLAKYQDDRFVTDKIVDIFLERDNDGQAYVVVSANLSAALRERIGQRFIQVIEDTVADQAMNP